MVIKAPNLKKIFLQKVESIVGAHFYSTRDIDRINYSRDSNFKGAIQAKFKKLAYFPDLIAWPQSTKEVQKLILLARQYKVPIVPYGAGSGVCAGVVPVDGGLVIDVKRMNRVLEFDPEALTTTIQAGIMGQTLEDELQRKGYTLGHFPSSIICASLGGYLAARSAGQMSTLFGKIEDMVLDLEIVTGTGEIIQTAPIQGKKGIDFNHLFMGSEGTLGVITQATLKMFPLSRARSFRGIRFPDMKTGMEAIRRIMQSGVRPSVVRLYDELDTLLLLNTTGNHDSKSFGSSVKSELSEFLKIRSLKFAMNMTSTATNLLQHLPCGCVLILMFEGHERLVKEELKLALELSCEMGAEDLGEEPGLKWFRKRYAISYNVSPLFYHDIFMDTIEVATTWDNMYPLYRGMVKSLKRHAMIMAHMSHVYNDGGALYFTFSAPIKSLRKAERLYDKIWDKALNQCQQLGAVLSHHHGIGRLKMKYMDQEWGAGVDLMREFKNLYDPDWIMNPGKLVGEIDAKKKKRVA